MFGLNLLNQINIYTIKPFSKDHLGNKKINKKALAVSIALGFLSVGSVHLGVFLTNKLYKLSLASENSRNSSPIKTDTCFKTIRASSFLLEQPPQDRPNSPTTLPDLISPNTLDLVNQVPEKAAEKDHSLPPTNLPNPVFHDKLDLVNQASKKASGAFVKQWLYKQMCLVYADLPLPSNRPYKVVLLNKAVGGKGDYAAASKVIDLIRDPRLEISWSSTNPQVAQNFQRTTNVLFANYENKETGFDDPNAIDLAVLGPIHESEEDYFRKEFKLNDKIPFFKFVEYGTKPLPESCYEGLNNHLSHHKSLKGIELWFGSEVLLRFNKKIKDFDELDDKQKQTLLDCTFKSFLEKSELYMGLDLSSGILLEQSEDRPLSQKYAHPEALLELEDIALYQEILQTKEMNSSIINSFNKSFSLNFGYAHYTILKGRFIDFAAAQEKNKNLVFVFHQIKKGLETDQLDYFNKKNMTAERIEWLKELGYQTIIIKSKEKSEEIVISEAASSRTLTIILRDFFSKNDIKNLRLASERILATGDDSAAEAFQRRFKFYMYENVQKIWDSEEIDVISAKENFLNQQIELSESINPKLGRLLTLASKAENLTKEMMQEAKEIFQDPAIEEAALTFSYHITKNYNANPIIQGAIKRLLWHTYDPSLIDTEVKILRQNTNLSENIKKAIFQSEENIKEIDFISLNIGDITSLIKEQLINKIYNQKTSN